MKPRKVKVNCPFFEVISDGGISNVQVGEGRFIPVIIIDAREYFEISELIKLHKDALPGDAIATWGIPDTFFKPKRVFLYINFINPISIDFAINFSLINHCAAIDGIIQANTFYLQVGKEGDKVSEQKNDSILIEVPSIDFMEKWEKLFFDTVKEKHFSNQDLSKREKVNMVMKLIVELRNFWNIRR